MSTSGGTRLGKLSADGWLGSARIYSLTQAMLGARAVRRRFLEEYVRPQAGQRVLDLGCGPGDILGLLPAVQYTGIDLSSRYVSAAQRRFGSRGRFLCADVLALPAVVRGPFDVVIAIGVVHHLDDSQAGTVASAVARLLARGGRFVTLDPGRTGEEHAIARWLVQRDRGSQVRSADGYRALIAPHFGSVEVFVHRDLARVPYTHVALRAGSPIAASA